MMGCNGKCKDYLHRVQHRTFAWRDGGRYCRDCEVFVDWEGSHCPCCNRFLRRGPRRMRSKLNAGIKVKVVQ